MRQETKQRLKDELVDHKCIASNSIGEEDPFVGVFFEDLCEIIDGLQTKN